MSAGPTVPTPTSDVPNSPSRAKPREIVGIVLFALSALSVVSLFSDAAGLIGLRIARGLRWFAGEAAWVPPVFALMAGVAVFRGRWHLTLVRRGLGCALGFASVLTIIHLWGQLPDYPGVWDWRQQAEIGARGMGGGVAGGVMAASLMIAFGLPGTLVLLAASLLISAVLVFDISFSTLVWTVVRGVGVLLWRIVRWVFHAVPVALEEAWLRGRRGWERRRAERELLMAASDPPRRRSRRRRGDKLEGLGSAEQESWDQVAAGRAEWTDRNGLTDPSYPKGDEPGDDDGSAYGIAGWKAPSSMGVAAVAPTRDDGEGIPANSTPGGDGADGEPQGPLLRLADWQDAGRFRMPSPSLLELPRASRRRALGMPAEPDRSQRLEETLASFGVEAKVVNVSRGPVITRYELQPAPGVKVSRIVSLVDDLSLALATAGVRIEAPVPGKAVVGIEVPNQHVSPVYLREVIESDSFVQSASPLTVALGKDIAGQPVVSDLRKLIHVLIAGATGSGKSVCLNAMIVSLLYKARPTEVKFIMVDPKRVELAVYDGIPHLMAPVVTDPRKASIALRWVVKEMERRYELFSQVGARNVDGYNTIVARRGNLDAEVMPYIVVVIDELADLMLVAAADVEDAICRLAQMARAAGIYLIIATQRPSVDVITGLIKANVPSRIAFAVSSQVDSRTILDSAGAERLLGKGDMLFHPIGSAKPQRVQGAFIDDREVEAIVSFWKRQGKPEYHPDVLVEREESKGTTVDDVDDELFEDAVRLVREQGQASVSMIQRRFRVGYSRAARLIDMMERRGIVGPYQGSKPREVLSPYPAGED